MARWYKYSGKPSGDMRIAPDRYYRLDASIPAPPVADLEGRLVYLNINPSWKLPKSDPMYWFQTAAIRVHWVRGGSKPDPTAYQTFAVNPWENFLISHTHWELGEARRGGYWNFRIRGMVTGATVGTRYCKGFIP